MENSIKRQSLELGAIWLIGSAVLAKLIGAFFKIPLASDSCLGDLGFGFFSSFYDLLLPFWTLSISGFPVAIAHFIAKYEEKSDRLKITQVLKCSKSFLKAICVLIVLLLIALYFPISGASYNDSNALLCFLAILPSALVSCAISYYRGYFEGYANMRPTAVSSLIEALGKLTLGYSFAYFTIKKTENFYLAAAASLFGISIGTLLSCVYLHFHYRKYGGKEISFQIKQVNVDTALKRSIIALSLTATIASLSSGIISLIDTLSVRTVLDVSIKNNPDFYKASFSGLLDNADVFDLSTILYGIKSKAHTVFNIFLTIAMAIAVTAMPTLSKDTGPNKKVKALNTVLRFTSLFTFPIAGGFIVIGKPIMSFLFGNGASSVVGGKILTIYGFAVIFAGFSIVLVSVIQAFGKHKFAFITIIFASLIKLALNLSLCGVSKLNIYACAFTTLFFYVILFIFQIFFIIKEGYFVSLKGVFLKPIFAALLSSLTALLISNFHNSSITTLISVVIAALVYFTILIVTRFFKRSDFQNFSFMTKFKNMFKKPKNLE